MESILSRGAPLDVLLEGVSWRSSRLLSDDLTQEGEGTGDGESREPYELDHDHAKPMFAPPARTMKRRHRAGTLDRLQIGEQLGHAAAQIADPHHGPLEGTRFVENFRYIVVASQLLDEQLDHKAMDKQLDHKAMDERDSGDSSGSESRSSQNQLNEKDLALILVVSFSTAWAFKWFTSGAVTISRLARLAMLVGLLVIGSAVHIRRRFVKGLRRQVLDMVAIMTNSLRAFERTTSTSLSVLQELELVSRGFRLSTPLPPVTRQDETKAQRRCEALRHQLARAFRIITKSHQAAHDTLQQLVNADVYDKFLDVYDISRSDIQDVLSVAVSEDVDLESLGGLRFLGHRASVLRRVLLCDLLSLDDSKDSADRSTWQSASSIMSAIESTSASLTSDVDGILSSLESVIVPMSPPSTGSSTKNTNERLRAQVRKITTLSTGIRTLQAKMTLLREESNTALGRAEDVTDLGPALLSQYESIGQDIRDLLADWETGRTILTQNIRQHHERRASLASSSGLRSPVLSQRPTSPLPVLVDPSPIASSPLVEGSLSPRSTGMPSTPTDDAEVFEAIALPRKSATAGMSREERIRAMQDERLKAAERREARESGAVMLRELKSVIGLRKRDVSSPTAVSANPPVAVPLRARVMSM